MKRDMELIRKILVTIQEYPKRPCTSEIAQQIAEVPPDEFDEDYQVSEEFGYQIEYLIDEGFIVGVDGRTNHSWYEFSSIKLTGKGEDFADTVANDSVWESTKEVLRDKEIKSATLAVWAQIAAQQLAKIIGL